MADISADALPSRRGGRPSRQQAEQLEERILACATQLFLSIGYSATSIEAIAQHACISKRTFYHRFSDKKDIFAAVIQRLVNHMRPEDDRHLFNGASLPTILLKLASTILRASVSPDAISLNRLLLSEAARVPELADIMGKQGARQEAIDRIAALLENATRHGQITVTHPHFAAEQFLHMVISVPQRRSLGMGKAMDNSELSAWAQQTVDLFLHGCKLKS